MRDSVPSARYSPVCNVLRLWRISLIPTYRVYRLYDIFIGLSATNISQLTESSLSLLAPNKALSSSRFAFWTRCAMFVAKKLRNVALGALIVPILHRRRHRQAVLQ